MQEKVVDNTISPEQMAVQDEYIKLCFELILSRFGDDPKAFVHVYGCQQNISDAERIQGVLHKMGFSFCDSVDDADLVLYITCAVREHAEDRVFGNVGALKHFKNRRPDGIVMLCGCMMQQPHVTERIKNSFPYVNLVFGTHVVYKLPELLYTVLSKRKRVFEISESDGVIVENNTVFRSGVKGWLPVMYGCNNFCSYCIVPYVRGRERSRKPDRIIEEARQMVAAGYKEITLLGQNVNSYGKTLDENIDFPDLLKAINDIDGDFVIRFMTSHPKDCTEKLLKTMSECEKVERHLHLPFQSGSDRILKLMNRRYTKDKYLSLIKMARDYMPDITFTSDIIVGFPGETEEDFEQTLDLIKKVEFSSLFTFIYSKRKGTPAAEMDDPTTDKEKSVRFDRLIKLQESISSEKIASMLGKRYRVFCEGVAKNGMISGRTSGNIVIEFPGDETLINSFENVEVTDTLAFMARGKLIK